MNKTELEGIVVKLDAYTKVAEEIITESKDSALDFAKLAENTEKLVTSSKERVAELHLNASHELSSSGDYAGAKKMAEIAQKILEKCKAGLTDKITAHLKSIGDTMAGRDQDLIKYMKQAEEEINSMPTDAIKIAERARRIADKITDPTTKQDILEKIGKIIDAARMQNINKELLICTDAIKTGDIPKAETCINECIRQMGLIVSPDMKKDAEFAINQKSKDIFKGKINMLLEEAKTLSSDKNKDYVNALLRVQEAAKIATDNNIHDKDEDIEETEVRIKYTVAIEAAKASEKAANFDTAITKANEALAFAARLRNADEANALTQQIKNYINSLEQKKAMAVIDKFIKAAEKAKKKDHAKAIEDYQKALKAVDALIDSEYKTTTTEKLNSLIANEQKEIEELEKKEMETIEKWCSENGLLGKEKLIKETLMIMNIRGVDLKKEQLEAENTQISQLIKETESMMLSLYQGAKGKKAKIKDLFAKCLAERKMELDELLKSDGSIYQIMCIKKLLPTLGNGDYEVQKTVYFANRLMTIIIDHEEFVKRMI